MDDDNSNYDSDTDSEISINSSGSDESLISDSRFNSDLISEKSWDLFVSVWHAVQKEVTMVNMCEKKPDIFVQIMTWDSASHPVLKF